MGPSTTDGGPQINQAALPDFRGGAGERLGERGRKEEKRQPGIVTTKVVPLPGLLLKVTSPRCSSAIFLTMANPSPVPSGLPWVTKLWNIRSATSGAMPAPVSVNLNT